LLGARDRRPQLGLEYDPGSIFGRVARGFYNVSFTSAAVQGKDLQLLDPKALDGFDWPDARPSSFPFSAGTHRISTTHQYHTIGRW
jgi:hypothetical protein